MFGFPKGRRIRNDHAGRERDLIDHPSTYRLSDWAANYLHLATTFFV